MYAAYQRVGIVGRSTHEEDHGQQNETHAARDHEGEAAAEAVQHVGGVARLDGGVAALELAVVERTHDEHHDPHHDERQEHGRLEVVAEYVHRLDDRLHAHARQDKRHARHHGQAVAVHVVVVALGIALVRHVHAAAHEIVEVRVEQVAERQQLVHLG